MYKIRPSNIKKTPVILSMQCLPVTIEDIKDGLTYLRKNHSRLAKDRLSLLVLSYMGLPIIFNTCLTMKSITEKSNVSTIHGPMDNLLNMDEITIIGKSICVDTRHMGCDLVDEDEYIIRRAGRTCIIEFTLFTNTNSRDSDILYINEITETISSIIKFLGVLGVNASKYLLGKPLKDWIAETTNKLDNNLIVSIAQEYSIPNTRQLSIPAMVRFNKKASISNISILKLQKSGLFSKSLGINITEDMLCSLRESPTYGGSKNRGHLIATTGIPVVITTEEPTVIPAGMEEPNTAQEQLSLWKAEEP